MISKIEENEEAYKWMKNSSFFQLLLCARQSAGHSSGHGNSLEVRAERHSTCPVGACFFETVYITGRRRLCRGGKQVF